MPSIIQIDNFGLTEKNGVAVVSSKSVAEIFGKRHDNVMRDIETAKVNFKELGALKFEETNFIKSTYRDSQNKKQPEFLLTRDGFSYIAMGFTGKKAAQFKISYINAFNQMESFIKNLLEAKTDFPEFTDAIMAAHDEPKCYHFSNECDMINGIVVGMSARKFREIKGIERGKSIRPYLTPEQIHAVKSLQRIDIGLIISIPDFQQRKQTLEQQYKRLAQKVLTA